MVADKYKSHWGLLLASTLLLVVSGGCNMGYSLRPVNWLFHNTLPSTCKTCPGGLPGSNGCRSFMNPWCAGYETTMWLELGEDCGPARLPSALAAATDTPAATEETTPEGGSGDAPPALPDAFPTPLPEPRNLPPALPDLPSDETGLPDQAPSPFPLKEVPTLPPNEDPTEKLPTPGNITIPKETPDDLFPESKPPQGNIPKGTTTPPTVIPEDINKLFETPDNKTPSKTTPGELPFDPEPAPKKPEDLPDPERKSPATRPADDPSSESLPDLFNEGDAKPLPNSSPTSKPAPSAVPREPARTPTLPDFDRTPSLEDNPDIFRKPPAKSEPEDSGLPKLFEDSSHSPPVSQWRIAATSTPAEPEKTSTLRFGRVIPTSAEEEPKLRVQLAGGEVDLGGGIYGPGSAHFGPPQPLLRMK